MALTIMTPFQKKRNWVVVIILLAGLVVLYGGQYYRIGPLIMLINFPRVISAPLAAQIYVKDSEFVNNKIRTYMHGKESQHSHATMVDSWHSASMNWHDLIVGEIEKKNRYSDIPFIYQSINADHLRELRRKYPLVELAGKGSEYQRMLRIFGWVGTRWDHGMDHVPGDGRIVLPAEVIAAGERGSRFWCETSARVTVEVATAMGWPARLVTASKDGYQWDHALAEVWSNQFNKWFLVDTDYNIIYESKGVPLSGFDLCHNGNILNEKGLLEVRRIAPLKPSLKDADLLFLYRYVHIDMRNDWVTRPLHAGSPAGGDFATWWTARDDLGRLLTAKIRVDEPMRYDWDVNWVEIYPRGIEKRLGIDTIMLGLRGYSPYFRTFALRQDDGAWLENSDGVFSVPLLKGQHKLEARVVTENEYGPITRINYAW